MLDFKYTQKYSVSREDYIVNYLEREELKTVMQFKAMTDCILASGAPTSETLERALTSIKNYIQMALPSLQQKDKIEDVKKLDKKDLESIKQRLMKAKAQQKK